MAKTHDFTLADVWMPRLMASFDAIPVPKPYKVEHVTGNDYQVISEVDLDAGVVAAIDAAVAAHDTTPVVYASAITVCLSADLPENIAVGQFAYVTDITQKGVLAVRCSDGSWRRIVLGQVI